MDPDGFPRSEIRLLREPLDMAVTGVTSIPHTDFEVGLDRELKQLGQATGGERLRPGRAAWRSPRFRDRNKRRGVEHAAEIMNRQGATKVEDLIGREPRDSRKMGENLPLSRDANRAFCTRCHPNRADPPIGRRRPHVLYGNSGNKIGRRRVPGPATTVHARSALRCG